MYLNYLEFIYLFNKLLYYYRIDLECIAISQPQNILLTDVPSAGDVKLCDFGLARPFNRGSDVIELVGTLDYVGTS